MKKKGEAPLKRCLQLFQVRNFGFFICSYFWEIGGSRKGKKPLWRYNSEKVAN